MIILANVVVKKYSKPGEHDICPNCNWEDDLFSLKILTAVVERKKMSLNEAKEAFKQGK
jgi:hypothetical protein